MSVLLDILSVIYNTTSSKECCIMYTIQYVRGHVEVYGADGSFLFSADNMQEARTMMEE